MDITGPRAMKREMESESESESGRHSDYEPKKIRSERDSPATRRSPQRDVAPKRAAPPQLTHQYIPVEAVLFFSNC